MIVLDASVAVKWFVHGEPLVREAHAVLDDICASPDRYIVPELFMNELLSVLVRLPGATDGKVKEALALVESLSITRVGNGHELLVAAADSAIALRISGYDALYLALARLSDGVWLTADKKAAKKVRQKRLVRVLGEPG